MQPDQIAINSISTRQQTLEEALAAYSGAGFRNVEYHLPLLKDWLSQGRTIQDARAIHEKHNLRCIGGFQAHLECFTSPDSRQANHRLHLENARLIHEMGGGTLVVGTDGPERPTIEALETVAAVMRGLAVEMEGLQVNLALEFNWSPLVKSLKSAALVCQKADHPRVGILFDPAHYYTTVTKLEHLDASAVRWIHHVHFNDMRDKPGELSNCNSDRVLPGDGILDLPGIISRLEEHGYQEYYSIEMFSEDLWQRPAAEASHSCYQSMRRFCR